MIIEETIKNNPIEFTIAFLILLNWISFLLLKILIKIFRFVFKRKGKHNTPLVEDLKPKCDLTPMNLPPPRFKSQLKKDKDGYLDLTK